GARVGVGDVSVHEGDAGARAAFFTVTLSRFSPTTVTVAYATSAATASDPADFKARSGVLTFPGGVTSLLVKVPISPDTVSEGSETFAVTLSGASGAKISRAVGTGTIIDDD
ncbi:MAG: Calx-beta domain-containing protein, partial [Acidimicrobiales bacterium]